MDKINQISKLYHGTNKKFDKFDFDKAKPFKDFGKGFYLTTDFNQAQKWAQRKGDKASVAYIYCYDLDKVQASRLNILELLKYDKEWLDFICESRIKGKETDYDIIYDRIADNQYSEISELLQEYMFRNISAEEVIKEIRWNNSKADQYCFKNEKALSVLEKSNLIIQYRDSLGRWRQEIC